MKEDVARAAVQAVLDALVKQGIRIPRSVIALEPLVGAVERLCSECGRSLPSGERCHCWDDE